VSRRPPTDAVVAVITFDLVSSLDDYARNTTAYDDLIIMSESNIATLARRVGRIGFVVDQTGAGMLPSWTLFGILAMSCDPYQYQRERLVTGSCVAVTESYFCDLSGESIGGAIRLNAGGGSSTIEWSTFLRCSATNVGGAVESLQALAVSFCCGIACTLTKESDGFGSFVDYYSSETCSISESAAVACETLVSGTLWFWADSATSVTRVNFTSCDAALGDAAFTIMGAGSPFIACL